MSLGRRTVLGRLLQKQTSRPIDGQRLLPLRPRPLNDRGRDRAHHALLQLEGIVGNAMLEDGAASSQAAHAEAAWTVGAAAHPADTHRLSALTQPGGPTPKHRIVGDGLSTERRDHTLRAGFRIRLRERIHAAAQPSL